MNSVSSSGRPRKTVAKALPGTISQMRARIPGKGDGEADNQAEGKGGGGQPDRQPGARGDLIAPPVGAEAEQPEELLQIAGPPTVSRGAGRAAQPIPFSMPTIAVFQ